MQLASTIRIYPISDDTLNTLSTYSNRGKPQAQEKPRVTLVTPSFNQGQYIEQTIDSVLSQGYSNLQYIIIDGGSTDNTHAILRRYAKFFDRLIIEPDNGSADAINKGLKLANGSWFNWLNSDDLLMPGALNLLAEHAHRWPHKQWITGCKVNIDASGRYVSSQAPWREDLAFWLLGEALFPQDATFIKTEFLRRNNLILDARLKNVYDTVLYLDLLAYSEPLVVSSVFSAMRWHPDQKTADSAQRNKEAFIVAAAKRRLPNYPWIAFLTRLCCSRASTLAIPFFSALAKLGLCPSRLNWDVEHFNVWEQRFESRKIKDFLAG